MNREGAGRGGGGRQPVEIAKDFNFQLPVIYVMLKVTSQVAITAKPTNFA